MYLYCADNKGQDRHAHLHSPILAFVRRSQIILTLHSNAYSMYAQYSRTSLSRTRLFRITAYLEVKTWFLF